MKTKRGDPSKPFKLVVQHPCGQEDFYEFETKEELDLKYEDLLAEWGNALAN